ncbi:MAG: hypothetical protein PHC44_01970, partial [Lutispora sp.]|nr:hypothetical protein [Lutispora sp.]
SRNILFQEIAKEYKYLWAELTEKDALLEDNKAYLVLQSTKPKSVLLFSQKNMFIEKALSSIEGLEIYKTNDVNISDDKYDLYIFDGTMPAQLPQSGNLFFINPEAGNPYLEVKEAIGGGKAELLRHDLNQHIDDYSFYIGKMKNIEKPYWADALMKTGQNIAAGAGVYEKRKIAYMAFDIHDSDFALNTAFPIFMYNISAYLTDMEEQGKPYYSSGETISLNFSNDIEEAVIENPKGDKTSMSKELLSYGFDNTGEVGIYKLSYKSSQSEGQRIFAVNFPREEAARAFEAQWEGERNFNNAGGYFSTGLNLRTSILTIVLLLLAAEWMVYINGN